MADRLAEILKLLIEQTTNLKPSSSIHHAHSLPGTKPSAIQAMPCAVYRRNAVSFNALYCPDGLVRALVSAP